MSSPISYAPLFDASLELSPDAQRRIGSMNALLVLRWHEWIHRRVEVLTFEDEDVVRRSNSVDFTVPSWYFKEVDARDSVRAVLPLTLLRKGTLVNFILRDECDCALPLLSTEQNGAVAEATLLSMAEAVLGTDVPNGIRSDIKLVTEQDASRAEQGLNQLFGQQDGVAGERRLLGDRRSFRSLAKSLAGSFLAMIAMDAQARSRRVVHFAYDEVVWENDSAPRVRAGIETALGRRAIRALIAVPGIGDVGSYHFEAEAPEGLQISSREDVATSNGGAASRPHETKTSYQRSHTHFRPTRPGSWATVLLRLRPRSSTIVRSACMAAVLAFAAILFARLRLHDIHERDAGGAAGILLVIPALAAVYAARSGEHPMTTFVLWPVRLLGLSPGVWALCAAAILVTGGTDQWSEVGLWILVGLAAGTAGSLALNWHRTSERARRSVKGS